MTITLSPQIEAKFLEKARLEGQDPDTLANDVLADYLASEAPTPEVPISAADIRAAIQSEHTKPIEQYIAEQRAKHGYPSSWPPRDAVRETAPGEFVNTTEHD